MVHLFVELILGPITSIRPSPDSGSFVHEYVIDDSVSAVGTL